MDEPEIQKLMKRVIKKTIKPSEKEKFSTAVKAAIKNGAKIDDKITVTIDRISLKDITPLTCLIILQSPILLECLLQQGACCTNANIEKSKEILSKCNTTAKTKQADEIIRILGKYSRTEVKLRVNELAHIVDFYRAIESHDEKAVQHFLTVLKLDPNMLFENGLTPIFLALNNRSKENPTIINLLCSANANLEFTDIEGTLTTPLHVALQRKLINSACTILTHIKDKKIALPQKCLSEYFYEALHPGHEEFLILFLEYKMLPIDSLLSNLQITPLKIACLWGNLKAVEILLNHGANPDSDALLHSAAEQGNYELVNLLLKNNAKILECDDGMTPIDIIIIANHTHLIPLFKDQITNEHVVLALNDGTPEMFKVLCKISPSFTENIFIGSIKERDTSGIQFLILKDFDFLALPNDQFSPFLVVLMAAACSTNSGDYNKIINLIVTHLQKTQLKKLKHVVKELRQFCIPENLDGDKKFHDLLNIIAEQITPKFDISKAEPESHWSPHFFNGASGYEYATQELGLSKEDIKSRPKKSCNPSQSSSPQHHQLTIFSWFDDVLYSSADDVKPISDPNNPNREAFLYISKNQLSEQGCLMNNTEKKTCFEFGGHMGKLQKLSGLECYAFILVNGIKYSAELTHELKLTEGSGADRVLVYQIKGTNLYVAAEHLENGLHTEEAIRKVKDNHKLINGQPSKIIHLELPKKINTIEKNPGTTSCTSTFGSPQ